MSIFTLMAGHEAVPRSQPSPSCRFISNSDLNRIRDAEGKLSQLHGHHGGQDPLALRDEDLDPNSDP
jgi:hypothetical protein